MILESSDPLKGTLWPLCLDRPFVAIAEYHVEERLLGSCRRSDHSVFTLPTFAESVPSDSKGPTGTLSAGIDAPWAVTIRVSQQGRALRNRSMLSPATP